MDRLFELEVFVAVLDAGTLSGAAKRLGRSGPAVTRILAALEDRLGARLFQRTTRRLALTEDGRKLELSARDLVSNYAGISKAVPHHDAYSGLMRITAPVVCGRLLVAPLVASFLFDHPHIDVELVLDDSNRDLVGEAFDVAVRIGKLADSGLVARRVGRVGLYLAASPDYLEHAGMPRNPSDLSAHALLQTVSASAPAEWRFSDNGQPKVVRFTPRVKVNHVETALALAMSGLGIVRALSYQVAAHLKEERLIRILSEFEPAARDVHIVHLGRRHMPERTRALVDHIFNGLVRHPYLQMDGL